MDIDRMVRDWESSLTVLQRSNGNADLRFHIARMAIEYALSRMRCERCKSQKTCVFYKAVMSIHGIGKSFNLFGCIHFEEKEVE